MEQVYTVEQVATHSTPNDAWVIFQGNVYDITKFIPLHPGGAALTPYLGQDVEKVWIGGGFAKHLNSNNAYSILSNYKIGRLVETFKSKKKAKKVTKELNTSDQTSEISDQTTESVDLSSSSSDQDSKEGNLFFFILQMLLITVCLGVVAFVLSGFFNFSK
jgi:cytochrome b involved in lipid metabolism